MITVTGFDQLAQQLDDAQKALAALGDELGTVSFDPNDPTSIETAILNMEATIDDRIGEYASNPIIAPLAKQLKEKYREGIIERAAVARLKADGEQ